MYVTLLLVHQRVFISPGAVDCDSLSAIQKQIVQLFRFHGIGGHLQQ
jgi:hypothetical protein